ncbi:MAG: hypothetical protein JW874_08320 [Spirochaetales bacterium]|nr:hypothetical protein [Spirochaetales bacterium]
MNRIIFFLMLPVLLAGTMSCATSSYNTAEFSESGMPVSGISMSSESFSDKQLEAIISTAFPPDKPVSIALYYLTESDRYSYGNTDFDPLPAVIDRLQTRSFIRRIVPVPKFLVPGELNIDALQQLGIRTLSEYSLIIYGKSRDKFFSSKSSAGHYIIASTLEFILLDNKTTAIIAADKLFSEKDTKFQLFSDRERTEALKIICLEQADLLNEKMEALFRRQ